MEGTDARTTGRVVIEAGVPDAFGINKGLRQGSVLSPLLFIIVLMKYQRRKRLCADDLATLRELHEALEECKKLFKARGLNMSLETTNVLRIGRQREEINIELDRIALRQGGSSVYLGGAVCGEGGSEIEVCRPEQTRGDWRAVEDVLADRLKTQSVRCTTCNTGVPVWD